MATRTYIAFGEYDYKEKEQSNDASFAGTKVCVFVCVCETEGMEYTWKANGES
jgi:hypothetical protein